MGLTYGRTAICKITYVRPAVCDCFSRWLGSGRNSRSPRTLPAGDLTAQNLQAPSLGRLVKTARSIPARAGQVRDFTKLSHFLRSCNYPVVLQGARVCNQHLEGLANVE